MDKKTLHMIAFVLVAVGGINWGLIGLGNLMAADWNVVHMILGSSAMLETVVYVLVGLATAYIVFNHKQDCKWC
jgi:uncharacterized membrane protein YuzA (DUF378 family)